MPFQGCGKEVFLNNLLQTSQFTASNHLAQHHAQIYRVNIQKHLGFKRKLNNRAVKYILRKCGKELYTVENQYIDYILFVGGRIYRLLKQQAIIRTVSQWLGAVPQPLILESPLKTPSVLLKPSCLHECTVSTIAGSWFSKPNSGNQACTAVRKVHLCLLHTVYG